MNLPDPLIKGKLLKRYKRFLCDVLLSNNEIVTAHCPNSGSMLTINEPNSIVYLSKITNNKAKLKYKLELLEKNNTLVGVNTTKANDIVLEALQNKIIPEFSNYSFIKKEAVFEQNCRFDFMLYNNSIESNDKCYIEVKSVTLQRTASLAEFPDAVTLRGQKHTEKLIEATQIGAKAFILYIIQREDCYTFTIAKDIDINYYNKINNAISQGVKILCYNCKITDKNITLKNPVQVII